ECRGSMNRSLKLYIAGLVGVSTIVLIAASLAFPADPRIPIEIDGQPGGSALEILLGTGFWVVLCLFASALPVRMPRGMLVAVSIAPILAATSLGGPAVGAWVAVLGSTELREVRGRIPWYGTAANHASIVLPTVAAGLVLVAVGANPAYLFLSLVGMMIAASVYFALNLTL